MSRAVKHFSLHRTVGTELRVISDVDNGVLPVIHIEEEVIRGYAETGPWPHKWVMLFILQDLRPLLRQLHPTADMPPGGREAMDERPVVNVYDLADQSGCRVFVNWQAMVKEGYWDDPMAVRGLLAHEHAHPLAENRTTRESRRLELDLCVERPGCELRSAECGMRNAESAIRNGGRQVQVLDLLNPLAHKLCLDAPREVFANEMAIRGGFGDGLLHLNRSNVANIRAGLAGREDVQRRLLREAAQGGLTNEAAILLMLIGDLRGYLEMAIETAPFYRAGREANARELEGVLESEVFPHLEPETPRAYAALREQYIALRADFTQAEMVKWGEGIMSILAQSLVEKGPQMSWVLRVEC